MMVEYSEYVVLGIAIVIGGLSYILKREHTRIDALECEHVSLNDRVSNAINEIAKNDVADREWRKRVEENHRGLLKADEDRRNDTRKIFDKIEGMKSEMHSEIQRLGELIAGKK